LITDETSKSSPGWHCYLSGLSDAWKCPNGRKFPKPVTKSPSQLFRLYRSSPECQRLTFRRLKRSTDPCAESSSIFSLGARNLSSTTIVAGLLSPRLLASAFLEIRRFSRRQCAEDYRPDLWELPVRSLRWLAKFGFDALAPVRLKLSDLRKESRGSAIERAQGLFRQLEPVSE